MLRTCRGPLRGESNGRQAGGKDGVLHGGGTGDRARDRAGLRRRGGERRRHRPQRRESGGDRRPLDPDAIIAAAKDAGPVDILFNCAGFVHQGSVLEATEEEWQFAFDLNARSHFRTIRAFAPGMIAKGGGSIINIASVAGNIKGIPSRAVYGASKAAVIGLTKAVAADFVKLGVRCNCICPGTVQSPSLNDRIAANAAAAGSVEAARAAFVARQAMGRLGTAEEIALMAVYLASDESVFVTGQSMIVDGGLTI
jgi:2-keto-3-deoxy-L-fuconate dehydrogenase